MWGVFTLAAKGAIAYIHYVRFCFLMPTHPENVSHSEGKWGVRREEKEGRRKGRMEVGSLSWRLLRPTYINFFDPKVNTLQPFFWGGEGF